MNAEEKTIISEELNVDLSRSRQPGLVANTSSAENQRKNLGKIEEEDEESQYIDEENIDWPARRLVFFQFIIANLFLNYDNGVIPSCLLLIEKDLQMGYGDIALLGSLVYFGLSCASLFVSVAFQKYNAKTLLGAS